MKALRLIVKELAGLFVDDKLLAAGIVAVVTAGWLLKASDFGEAAAAILFLGCIALLVVSALSAGRK